MRSQAWKWGLGLIYILAVTLIWIAASFVIQSVEDSGISPFLITYICSSLFVVYIPMVEIARYLEDSVGNFQFWRNKNNTHLQEFGDSEEVFLLGDSNLSTREEDWVPSGSVERGEISQKSEFEIFGSEATLPGESSRPTLTDIAKVSEDANVQVDEKGRWTRIRTAKVSLLISPFWFFAQLTFNLSLKYTSVTSNTIISSASSLFTFLVSLVFLGERFTWVKLIGVLLCMGGTIVVSLGDSGSGLSAVATKPLLGDILALVSAGLYAVYITLIRKNLPNDDDKCGRVSMAQFLGFLGLFNLLIFLPVALVLNFTKLEPFHVLSWKQLSLIVGKGLLDDVLSDYLWAKAVLLTTTTVATTGLTIQVPMAAVVDLLTGNSPNLMDYLGAAMVMFGFAGINIPLNASCGTSNTGMESEAENVSTAVEGHNLPISRGVAPIS